MGKRDVESLNKGLSSYMSNVHETLQILDQTPASSLRKVSWDEAVKMGEQLSKQATTAGMLFTGERTEVKALEENMEAYFNVLQGLLLLAYGSTVGAGPTLRSYVHASIKQAIDCSFVLWRECVSSYGSHLVEQKQNVPQRVGTVWEVCSTLKKTPATNIIAIGRAMTQVAVSMKDVLRELNELEQCSDPIEAFAENGNSERLNQEATSERRNQEATSDTDDGQDEYDFGKDLSPEEMKIAQLAIRIVSEAVIVIKELIRSITGLVKKGDFDESDGVESLENLLKLCRDVGDQVDELGACLYPPQELSAIMTACEKMSEATDEMRQKLEVLKSSTKAFSEGCKQLQNSLEMLRLEVSSYNAAEGFRTVDMATQMQKLAVDS